jgi:IstB-like ATP binding protein
MNVKPGTAACSMHAVSRESAVPASTNSRSCWGTAHAADRVLVRRHDDDASVRLLRRDREQIRWRILGVAVRPAPIQDSRSGRVEPKKSSDLRIRNATLLHLPNARTDSSRRDARPARRCRARPPASPTRSLIATPIPTNGPPGRRGGESSNAAGPLPTNLLVRRGHGSRRSSRDRPLRGARWVVAMASTGVMRTERQTGQAVAASGMTNPSAAPRPNGAHWKPVSHTGNGNMPVYTRPSNSTTNAPTAMPSTMPVMAISRPTSIGRRAGVRQQIAALASGAFLSEARNVVLLGPPGTGKTHLATALGVIAAHHGHRVLFATPSTGSLASPKPTASAGSAPSSPGYAATG